MVSLGNPVQASGNGIRASEHHTSSEMSSAAPLFAPHLSDAGRTLARRGLLQEGSLTGGIHLDEEAAQETV